MSAAEYEENVGNPPPVDESEEAWQWEYRGTRQDRERLAEWVGDVAVEQEESLF